MVEVLFVTVKNGNNLKDSHNCRLALFIKNDSVSVYFQYGKVAMK